MATIVPAIAGIIAGITFAVALAERARRREQRARRTLARMGDAERLRGLGYHVRTNAQIGRQPDLPLLVDDEWNAVLSGLLASTAQTDQRPSRQA